MRDCRWLRLEVGRGATLGLRTRPPPDPNDSDSDISKWQKK